MTFTVFQLSSKMDPQTPVDPKSVFRWILLRDAKAITNAAISHDVHIARTSWLSWLHGGPSKGLGRQRHMSRIAQGWVPSKIGETHDSDDDSVCYSDVERVTEENVSMVGNLVSVPLVPPTNC